MDKIERQLENILKKYGMEWVDEKERSVEIRCPLLSPEAYERLRRIENPKEKRKKIRDFYKEWIDACFNMPGYKIRISDWSVFFEKNKDCSAIEKIPEPHRHLIHIQAMTKGRIHLPLFRSNLTRVLTKARDTETQIFRKRIEENFSKEEKLKYAFIGDQTEFMRQKIFEGMGDVSKQFKTGKALIGLKNELRATFKAYVETKLEKENEKK